MRPVDPAVACRRLVRRLQFRGGEMIRCYGLDWSYDRGVTGRCGSGPKSDLHAMHGIYVLYDRKGELAYVGRSSEGDNPGIAGRLKHHCVEKGWDFDA